MGALAGAIPGHIPLPLALAPLFDAEAGGIVFRHLPKILTSALLLAIVGALESVLVAKASDRAITSMHDANGDLLAFGLGNVASGVFGGLPIVDQRERTAAILEAGGRSWRAAAYAAVASGVLFLVAAPVFALVPLAVLAGILLRCARGSRSSISRARSSSAMSSGCRTSAMRWPRGRAS
jgi:MFS superfamily sulfate permease-like transporter